MTVIVTGAAGFIGSNIVAGLNARGVRDIVAVDDLTRADKFRNLADLDIVDYIDKAACFSYLQEHEHHIEAIFHQGANSDTMATDGKAVMENNYRYSQQLLHMAAQWHIPFLYASSAAVYGASSVFVEKREHERPLNVYGYSKFLFDVYVRHCLERRLLGKAPRVAGFRYFNVYGPREQHKGRMASVAYHHYCQWREQGKVALFRGSGGYVDGGQLRDFVYVKDVVAVNLFFADAFLQSGSRGTGIYNLGSGKARSFNDLACAVINCLNPQAGGVLSLAEVVARGWLGYVDFPPALVGKYQSFTQSNPAALVAAGYQAPFTSLEAGVADYMAWLSATAA